MSRGKPSLGQLERIFGKGNASVEPAELMAYSSDASQHFGKASAIVFPTNSDQIRKLVIYAGQHGHNLVPRGSGTGLAGAAVPDNSIVVDMSRMDRIIQLNIRESYAIVEPGVVIDRLNEELEKHGLYFPIMPASHEACTLGGLVAANAAGMRAIKYGKAESWVLGLKAIDGTGKSYTFTGKNDFIGAEGIFGFITELKLRLTNPVRHYRAELLKMESAEELVEWVERVKKEKNVICIEFTDRISSQLAGLSDRYHLFVEYEEEPQEEDSTEEIVRLRESVSVVLGSNGYLISEDPKLPPERLSELLEWLYSRLVPCFGHIGIGVIHPRFRKDQRSLIREMMAKVREMGGIASGEHGIGIEKKQFLDEEKIVELRGLKYVYDPKGIINPGKVI